MKKTKYFLLLCSLTLSVACGMKPSNLVDPISRIAKIPKMQRPEQYSSLRWSESRLPIRIVAPVSKKVEIEASLSAVCDKWNTAIGRNVIEYSFENYNENVTNKESVIDGKIRMYFPSSWGPLNFQADALGTTYYSYIGTVLYEGDIFINTSYSFYYTDWNNSSSFTGASQYDFQAVLLHEVGHLLGQSHSTKPGSIMEDSIAPNEAKRELSLDDEDEIYQKYRQ